MKIQQLNIKTIACLLGISYCLSCTNISEQKQVLPTTQVEKPNLITFIVDDWGWQDLSFALDRKGKNVTPWNKFYKTPEMDKFAKKSLIFHRAYASTVCTPSRCSFMTGQSDARHQITQWTKDKDKDPSKITKKFLKTRWKVNGLGEQDREVLLPWLLQEAGYKTIHVGKAHFGAEGTSGADPRNLGFDVNVAGSERGGIGSHYAKNKFIKRNNYTWQAVGLNAYHGSDEYLTDILTKEAIKEIKKAIKENKPFYLNLSHYAVHVPLELHPPHGKGYNKKKYKQDAIKYASMVRGVSKSFGSIIEALKSLKIADKTIIVLTSDNGGLNMNSRIIDDVENKANYPLRSGKGFVYEGGIKIPFFIGWAKTPKISPIQFDRGFHEHSVAIQDIYPTFLHLAGTQAPQGHLYDGENLVPYFKDRSKTRSDKSMIFHFPHSEQQRIPFSAIIKGDYKAIFFYEPEKWELYNLKNDIKEENNLIKENRDVYLALANELKNYLKNVKASLPILKTTNKPIVIKVP